MASAIDPTKPVDGVPAIKADLRSNLQSAKDEIEALQSGKTDLGHQHGLADITDAGALAGKNSVAMVDIDDNEGQDRRRSRHREQDRRRRDHRKQDR